MSSNATPLTEEEKKDTELKTKLYNEIKAKSPMEKLGIFGGLAGMWDIKYLVPSPINMEIFHDLDKEDYEELKKSIKENGIIEPLIVRDCPGKKLKYKEVLCGSQRLKIAKEIGLTELPIIYREDIRDDDNVKATTILIEDNLRRRQLSPSEMAKAIAKLYELKGIKAGRPENSAVTTELKDITDEVGLKERQVRTLATIGKNLIEQWHTILHKKGISIENAYGLAQLDPEIQKNIYEAVLEEGKGTVSEKPQIDKTTLETEIKKAKEDAFQSGYEEAIAEKGKEIENLKEEIANKNQRIRELDLEIDETSSTKLKKEIDKLKVKLETIEKEKAELSKRLETKPTTVMSHISQIINAFVALWDTALAQGDKTVLDVIDKVLSDRGYSE